MNTNNTYTYLYCNHTSTIEQDVYNWHKPGGSSAYWMYYIMLSNKGVHISMYVPQSTQTKGKCCCNAQLKTCKTGGEDGHQKWGIDLGCPVLTISCRLGLASAPRRTSTTLWWPLMLAFSSAVRPFYMVEWVRETTWDGSRITVDNSTPWYNIVCILQ